MKVFARAAELAAVPGPVVLAVGVFDGVHLGHRAVIERAIGEAARAGGAAVAVTFDPHPSKILRPDSPSRLLTATGHKLRLLAAAGLGHALVIPFDEDFARTPAADFLAMLREGARPLGAVVVGAGWAFGRGRGGTVALVRSEGARWGFRAIEIEPVEVGGEPVSSTRIREAIRRGDFDEARACLGRDYSVLGSVVEGDRLGRKLGFPTANLRAHNEQFPPDGVYAARASWSGRSFACVANVGVRPTLGSGGERRLEIHLLDFEGDLYGEEIEVTFTRFLRGERRFAGLAELRAGIAADIEAARALEMTPGAITVRA